MYKQNKAYLANGLKFKLFGITYLYSRENKPFKLFFHGPGRLSEKGRVETTGCKTVLSFKKGMQPDQTNINPSLGKLSFDI